MRIASLGSGSKGNATVIQTADSCLLVDCGFNSKQCHLRMDALGIKPELLDGILVTHEHGDHIGGVYTLVKQYGISVYMTQGTADGSKFAELGNLRELSEINIIDAETDFNIGDINIRPVVVPHDAREPCQFVFNNKGNSVGVLTDVGCITPHIEKQYSACDVLMLEFNHDLDTLEKGPYPEMLKERVGGDYGHLNNNQAADLLKLVEIEKIQHLLIAHISEKNNSIDAVTNCLNTEVPILDHQKVHFIDQKKGLNWRLLD